MNQPFIALTRRAALVLAALAPVPGAWAQTGALQPVVVAGVEFAPVANVGNQALILNGAGSSNIMSARTSAVGLYLPTKTQDTEQALTMQGPKRIAMVALRDLSAKDLSNAFVDRMRQNAAPGEIEANIIQIAGVGGVFGTRPKLLKGELLTIDYLPAVKSTEFRINGQLQGQAIGGEKLFPLVMKVWIGPRIRASTRESLMGRADKE